jgi:hypothetical protein
VEGEVELDGTACHSDRHWPWFHLMMDYEWKESSTIATRPGTLRRRVDGLPHGWALSVAELV